MPELDLDELLAAYQRASPPVRAKPSPPKPGLNGLLLPDSSQERINEAEMILEAATVHHKPSHLFLLFSGGHDSLATTHLSFLLLQNTLRRYPTDLGYGPRIHVLHINTGIGVPQTRDFVRLVSWNYGWNYLEYRTPVSYVENVLTYGFPGPAQHTTMYSLLKERALRLAVRDLTPLHPLQVHQRLIYDLLNDMQPLPLRWQYALLRMVRTSLSKAITAYRQELRPMAFITGVRRAESVRRMGNVVPLQKHGRHWWLSPLTHWSKDDVLDYMEEAHLPHNPVVDTIHKSGECLCGAFAEVGELEELCLFWPEVGAYIKQLERQVREAGFPWGWETRPPSWWNTRKKGQLFLPGWEDYMMRDDPEPPGLSAPGFSPLCSSCNARFAESRSTGSTGKAGHKRCESGTCGPDPCSDCGARGESDRRGSAGASSPSQEPVKPGPGACENAYLFPSS